MHSQLVHKSHTTPHDYVVKEVTCMYAEISHMRAMLCRLLAWATDIVTQLEQQRHELRRSRMELASAQEVRPEPPCRHAWGVVSTGSIANSDGLTD